MDWQPIETAPKYVGVLLFQGSMVAMGCWSDWGWVFWEGDQSSLTSFDTYGVAEPFISANYWHSDFGPTHWMPLPEPPK